MPEASGLARGQGVGQTGFAMRQLRNAFFTGLLLCLPLALTFYVVCVCVNFLAKPLQGVVVDVWGRFLGMQEWTKFLGSMEGASARWWIEQSSVVVSALVVVLCITFIGMLSRWFLGRFVINSLEKIIERVPVVKSVYSTIKQLVAMFGSKSRENFKQVVLVPFPHAGSWAVAFVTNRSESEISEKLGYAVVHVFVATTPNPTGGYFLVYPETDVKFLNMSVADGLKLVVSCGAVLPEKG